MTYPNLSEADLFSARWYAVVDDVVGGWSVATVDKPTSEHDPEAGEGSICDFASEVIARHVVDLHNEALDGAQPLRYRWEADPPPRPRLRVINLPGGEFLIVLDRCSSLLAWGEEDESEKHERLSRLRDETGAKYAVAIWGDADVGVVTVDVEPMFEIGPDDVWVDGAVEAVKAAREEGE